MIYMLIVLATLLQISPDNSSVIFYDDFSDGDISDWDQRLLPGTWSSSSGQVHGSTSYASAALVTPGNIQYEDCSISISGMAVHVIGVISRLNSEDTGIVAYVSPDHDVARIRRISNTGAPIYNSLYASFPSGVWYELTLICEGSSLQLQIEVPSTGESWTLNATDPSPQTGQFGLYTGGEPSAHWDWISVSSAAGPVESTMISWMYTDDTALGNGNMAFESGEEIALHLQLSNPESAPLENVFAVLQSLTPEIIVSDNYDDFGNIPVGGSSWGTGGYCINAPASTPEDQTYAMQLTVFADGGYSNTVEFSIPVGCGIECDVESGIEQWSWNAVEVEWLDNWHISSSRNHTEDGTQSFKCGDTGSGDYDNHLFSAVTSPLLNIPIGGDISFWIWIDAHIPLNNSGISAFDGGLLQYGRCGTWIDLEPSGGYPYQIIPSSTGPFTEGTGVFSGQSGWSQWVITIPDSLAGPGQIRFVFGSDDTGTREGLYVDDIHIQGSVGIENPEYGGSSTPLLSAYPNPFMENMTFVISGIPLGDVTIEIFDLAGRLVAAPRSSTPGEVRTMMWNEPNIPAGIYIARVCIQDAEDVILHIVKLD
ncbi:MAG: T9SS type A sorting domain-containing protein, partial [Candidatus Aegiribacteria sp.]|nr:T9SS type A sorting domain-containing protein [Candidatus Aegiribacteria sp.]